MTARDKLYESELIKHVQKTTRFLDQYQEKQSNWDEADYLAIERALQILIEALIGFCRYALSSQENIHVEKSREAVDELKSLGILTDEDYVNLTKIIGFRNVLVHDYLKIDRDVVRAIITKRQYVHVTETLEKLMAYLK